MAERLCSQCEAGATVGYLCRYHHENPPTDYRALYLKAEAELASLRAIREHSHAAASDIAFMLSGGVVAPETWRGHVAALRAAVSPSNSNPEERQ